MNNKIQKSKKIFKNKYPKKTLECHIETLTRVKKQAKILIK